LTAPIQQHASFQQHAALARPRQTDYIEV